jgi:hypothetical protein
MESNAAIENPPVAETDIDKPLFKASDGGYFEMARVTEDSTKSRLQQDSEIPVPVGQKVRPEPFPNGLPMSAGSDLLQR